MTNINTLRMIATILLVTYHVIGVDALSGMKVSDGSAWRTSSDILLDLRMPFFAFIAGAVYAFRPMQLATAHTFMSGKVRRLVVPGLIAAVLFWVLGNTLFTNSFASGKSLLGALFLSYGHFWFLQAILLIFLTIGPLDALLGYRHTMLLLVGSIALMFTWPQWLILNNDYLRILDAAYLAPYFILGMLILRRRESVMDNLLPVLFGAAAYFAIGLFLDFEVLHNTGHFSLDRFDVQSLAMAGGAVLILYLVVPRWPAMDRIAVYSFTIYLYHPLGTTLSRRLLDLLGIGNQYASFILGLLAGLLVPVLIHKAAAQSAVTARYVLGLRTDRRPVGGQVPRTL